MRGMHAVGRVCGDADAAAHPREYLVESDVGVGVFFGERAKDAELLVEGTTETALVGHVEEERRRDDQLRADQLITNEEELKAAMEHFQLTGQSATDFRPVFAHVDCLLQKGELRDLRGLLYFTDGLGIYPARRPAYDAAFVMLAQQGFPERVPPWGIRVLLDEDELIQADACPDTLSEEDHT